MFKKSLAAAAVLGAFAASSMAADVTLYGVVDYGMKYLNQETKSSVAIPVDDANVSKFTTDGFTLDSGVNAGSRIGIKGSEDLGNGYVVSFKLENGFDADDGELGQSGRLFGREASLTIASDWGKLSAGRMGALGSAAGSYDTVFAIGDAFDGGDNDIFSMATTDRYDNMLTYQSPKVAGLQLTAQYSFKLDNKHEWPKEADWSEQAEGHNSADRYAGIALTGEYGAFQGVAAYEQIMRSTAINFGPMPIDLDDTQIFSLGGNYDFGVAKLFAMGQYYENATLGSAGLGNIETNAGNIGGEIQSSADGILEVVGVFGHMADGYSLHVGTQAPLFAGTLTAGLYYTDAEAYDEVGSVAAGFSVDFEEIAASVKYEYPLSARTTLYSAVGYSHAEADVNPFDETVKANTTQAYFGITHAF